ncbi:hypothetical protein BD408DRAFT_401184 [Parasitella parasitica]|nr:hypothetical protein BD408DRAFT_401184 [Parasitella parasitica]
MPKKRQRIAFISHESAIATFFHNPEQGSRDAANLVDVDVEWNHYLAKSESKMAQDIHDAVNKGIDGIITSIPNDSVFQAVEYAVAKNIPVIVFNTGLDYARQLGLTRVLQDDVEAGNMLGEELYNANFSKPLAVQLSSLDDYTSKRRRLGIEQAIGYSPTVLKIYEASNMSAVNRPVQLVRDAFLSNAGAYDSIISLGGSLLTGQDVYRNQTIKTGPNLVTNATLSYFMQNEANSLMSINDKSGSIGALVPHTRGDTYNAAMMAGVTNLAQKLNWTVYNPKEGVDGILVQSSSNQVLEYANNAVAKAKNAVGVVALGSFFEKHNTSYSHLSNVALDMVDLSKSIANKIAADGKTRPVCITERSTQVASPFCHYFYEAYQQLQGNSAAATADQVVKSVNVSYPGAMENEFMTIIQRLYEDDSYEPDSFVTFSEYVFTIINSVISEF